MPNDAGSPVIDCILCERAISGYRAELHDLVIDEQRTVRVCDDCAGKVLKWQTGRLATLFPTKAMKRRRQGGG